MATTTKYQRTIAKRRKWPVGTRLKLVARDALIDRMARRDMSRRTLADFAKCAPGTIDNLINGTTSYLNKPAVAERICEVLDVPLDVFFVPFASSVTPRATKRQTEKVAA